MVLPLDVLVERHGTDPEALGHTGHRHLVDAELRDIPRRPNDRIEGECRPTATAAAHRKRRIGTL